MALRSTDERDTGPVRSPQPPRSGRQTVAAFDFDGTLTNGGSVFPWLVSLRGPVAVLRATFRFSPGLVKAAITGGAAADQVKERLFTRLIGGLPVGRGRPSLPLLSPQRHLARHLRDDTRHRLEWHRRQGHHTVIVSASPECYVGPAGERARGRRRGGHPSRRRAAEGC